MNKPTMSKNMTETHLDAVMSALPPKMDNSELCALTLTLYSAFIDDPAEIISELLTAIYCFGESRGMSKKTISLGLRMTAEMYEATQTKQTAH